MEVCDVGKLTFTKCHLTDYSNLKTLHNVDQFSNEDRLLLKLRLNNANNISKICDHHKCDYLNYYSVKFRKCCDPFQIHKKNVRGDLRILSLELCLSISTNLLLKLIPGDKICKRCENNLRQKISSQEKNKCSTSQETTDQIDMIQEGTVYDEKELRRSARLRISEMNKTTTQEIIHCSQSTNSTNSICITSRGSEFMTASQDKQDINHILTTLDLPLYEQQALYKTKHQVQAENLVQAVSDKFAKKLSQVADLNITIPDPVNTNLYQDSFALREMIMNLRYLYDNAKTLSEKLEYLSLLPKDWTLPKVLQYFSCTNYMWLKLNKFKQMQGYPENLKNHERKKNLKFGPEMQEKIIDYYKSDENSSTCPGKKDYVTAKNEQGQTIFIQKKLLLYTVHDLYLKFIDDNSGTNEKLPKFSYFASLKPIEIIHAGDHSWKK